MEEYLKGEVPSKVAFFVWTMANGRILTTHNLSMWRMCVVDEYCMFEEWEGLHSNMKMLFLHTLYDRWQP